MDTNKKATIKDVAQKSGFSTTTVSRVLNGDVNISPETRKKVWTAAHSLNYEPSIQARKLRLGIEKGRLRTNLIMRIFNLGSENPIGDRTTADSVQMFDWLATQRGYYTTNYRYFQKEGFHCPLILDQLVDGVIIGSPHPEVIECVSRKVPTVLLNMGNDILFPELPRVNSATANGLQILFQRAYALGHRHAALVGSLKKTRNETCFQLDHVSLIIRLLKERGIELSEEHKYQPPDLSWQNHEEKMHEEAVRLKQEILARKISLIVCENAPYAESIYNHLRNLRIRIPEDVSLVTLDTVTTVPGKDYFLTSVLHDWERLFIMAIDVLKDRIDGKELFSQEFIVPSIQMEKQTLAKVPGCNIAQRIEKGKENR